MMMAISDQELGACAVDVLRRLAMTELVLGIRSDQACISRENCQKEKVMRQLSSFWWLS